jgi:DNA topoisomerase VI subunit B
MITRTPFKTSRLLDFTSRRELEAQTGHPAEQWARVVAKELGDNGLDACEEHHIAPELTFTVDTKRGTITVEDNGPGIPSTTVKSLLDFDHRTSSREAYVCPTRGAQGNAWQTLLWMPHALGAARTTIIEARSVRHRIKLHLDAVRQRPVLDHATEPCARLTGTSVVMPWPHTEQKQEFLQLLFGFALFNPHASIHVSWDGETHDWPASDAAWKKWTPGNPTPPGWYDDARFQRLVAAEAHHNGSRTVREFVSEFRGLSRSPDVADVLASTTLARTTLAELFRDGKPTSRIAALLAAMQAQTTAVKPADLGVIGKDHFRSLFARLGGNDASFQYKRIETTNDADLPVIVEVAFAYNPRSEHRLLLTGINHSPAISNPFRYLGNGGEGLERVLSGQRCESDDPIIVAVHLSCPAINYLDRGKGAIALRGAISEPQEEEEENDAYWLDEVADPNDGSVAGELIAAVKHVTKRWLKQRKAEERHHQARANRNAAMAREHRESQAAVAREVIERGFLHVSGPDGLPANARQIMYACRDEIQQRSCKQLDDTYFTQTLLPNYIAEFDPPWKNKVVYDDRGHLREPHTNRMIGLGTVSVRDYLERAGEPKLTEQYTCKVETQGPSGRYVGVLFVEKEGFDALFDQVRIAERYDLAPMSTKGISVTAARELADEICHRYNVPLFLLTDFDKSGFSGAGTFQKDNRRYTFKNEIKVNHIGLRLTDVRRLRIEGRAELAFDKGTREAIRANLRANGATGEEIEFLAPLSGGLRRVELNVLTSAELVSFVERKLKALGVRKLVPEPDDLAEAYRLFARGTVIRKEVAKRIAGFGAVEVPADLGAQVRAMLKAHPAMAWDEAVAIIAGWSRKPGR